MMTHGDMPLGWGWFPKLSSHSYTNYFVVRVGTGRYLYQNKNGYVHRHSVNDKDSVPGGMHYPHFFLPVGVI